MSKLSISVSVRDLVEFVLRRGDLGTDQRFAGPGRALEGTRGHQRIQRSRPAHYQAEVPLSQQIEAPDFVLNINGRVDGILPGPDAVLLEEIKTVSNGWQKEPDPLHWAQAKIYAGIFLSRQPLARIDVQLTYLELDSDQVTPYRQRCSDHELKTFFEEVVHAYTAWLTEQNAWRQLRDTSIRSLPFPFAAARPGQPELMAATARTLTQGGKLFAEAPTGIGKTISVLYAAVKALGQEQVTKIFYLTAKTLGRTVAEKAFADLRAAGLRLRTLTLTAKEKLCFNNGQPCDVRTCPYALGYYDRYRNAMRNALQRETLTRAALEEIARQHQVCPSALCSDTSRWVDAVICDYNYVFDPKVYLRRFFDQEPGGYVFLVDEAHNLVERGREMFSADLEEAEVREVQRTLQRGLPRCAKWLGKVARHLAAAEEHGPGNDRLQRELASAETGPPQELMPLLKAFLEEAEAWLVQNRPADFRDALLSLYFRIADFRHTFQLYDERFVTIRERSRGRTRLKLYCLDPSALLHAAIQRARSTVFFSATLAPVDYYREIFGYNATDAVLQLPSPFPEENLCVLIADHIATNYQRRAATYDAIAQSIAAVAHGRAGNYLVYFPSYQYLHHVLERFRLLYPDLRTLAQSPRMAEEARDVFLQAFRAGHDDTLVGFAVMGGIFGEGIDLVGDHLLGAVIVGVGLPQLCLERDLIRDYFDARHGAGFDYAYAFPGMTRVFQSAGRVIRSETDRGVVLLIDTRFARSRYRRLFPPWWKPQRVQSREGIAGLLERFWNP